MPGDRAALIISGSSDPVSTLPAVGLVRGEVEPEFLFEGPGEGTAHRVRLMPMSA